MSLSSPFIDQLTPSAIRYITTRIREDTRQGRKITTFAGGMPCSDYFPTDSFHDIFQEVLKREGATAFQYAATDGYNPLREQIVKLVTKVGIQTAVPNILVKRLCSRSWVSSRARYNTVDFRVANPRKGIPSATLQQSWVIRNDFPIFGVPARI